MAKELNLTRVFDVSIEPMFAAWTEPQRMALWWDPKYFFIPVCELDARPGGAMRIVMRGPDGVDYPMTGVYHEVERPNRNVFTSKALVDEAGHAQLETLTSVTLVEVAGQTQVLLNVGVTHSTAAAAEAMAGMPEGWRQSLDRLKEHLEPLRKESDD